MKKDHSEITYKELKTGDFLFTSQPSCYLSQAINKVTGNENETQYSHVGIVERKDDIILVYHSTPKRGVFCEPLDQFFQHCEKEIEVIVYRLKDQYQELIPAAIDSAKGLLGQNYNHSFRITDPGYYCSEFIYRIFLRGNIFDLNPMTFKDPHSSEFTHQWIEYYTLLGSRIPERQPGCNPNGMAVSVKLELVGKLKNKNLTGF